MASSVGINDTWLALFEVVIFVSFTVTIESQVAARSGPRLDTHNQGAKLRWMMMEMLGR
jgi:hypothetical protein